MLPKRYKLKKENDFKKVFQQGRFYQDELIRLKVLANQLKENRFGFVIGIKISKKATERNRLKRRLEELVRLNLGRLKPGFDTVIFPRPETLTKGYQQLEKILFNLFKKANLLK